MCDICTKNDGDWGRCEFCSAFVCFDVQSGDDIVRPARATSGGDLVCSQCFKSIADDEQEQDEECGDYFPDPYEDEESEHFDNGIPM